MVSILNHLQLVRSMDMLEVVRDKVEPDYKSGEVDASESRVVKRTKVFNQQIMKGVADMKVQF